jgi:2-hydroxychromene-2-carboxylate isomerase
MNASRTVEFYFCAACPWSYLAFVRLVEAAQRTAATIEFRPIVALDLPSSSGEVDRRHATQPAVADYARKDLQDWARFCGVRLDAAAPQPVSTEWAQRGAVAAVGLGDARRYVSAVYRARFERGIDIAPRAAITALAAGCGLSGPEFIDRLDDAASLESIRRNREALLRRGGFGSPSMFVGNALYFGHDRLPLVEAALLHHGERPFVAPGEHHRP